ncbi:MAG: TauD/TfdA family dioxygenase, partial [Pseudomonadota bacterium]
MNPLEAIDHRSAWRADSSSADTFTVSLSAKHLDAIDRAVRHVQSLDIEVESITRDQFELPDIREDVAQWRNEVMWGTGIIILDGFPVDSYSKEEMGIVHWGLGTHFGTAMSQSVMGDRLGHVINVGGKDPKERAYRNSLELAMHTDACDVVAMMSLRTAREGGESGYVSAISIYNEVLRRAPELMPVLMDGYFYHRFGEEEPGASPVTEQKIPVFSFEKGYLSVNFLRSYIEMAAE